MSGLTLDKIKHINTIPLNFVMGKERSGTTLLQIMLNTHPDIVAPPESRFIILLYSRYGGIKKWSEEILTRFCDDVLQEKSIANFWAINRDDLLATLLSAKDIATYPLLCKLVFYFFSPGKDSKMFFDKNPLYAYYYPELRELFPEAKYIHLVRDYRATIVSHRNYRSTVSGLQRAFIVSRSTDIAYQWLKMNKVIEKAKISNKENYFTLKYESLVSEPVKSIVSICHFLGVPYVEKMALQHSSGIYPLYSANTENKFREIHRSVFAPLTSSYIDKWEKTLTSDDIEDAESIAGEYAEKMYGYKKYSAEGKAKLSLYGKSLTKLKYGLRNRIYLLALNNPGIYFLIKKYIWKYF